MKKNMARSVLFTMVETMIKVVNIKQHNPNNEYAVYMLDCEINDAKVTNINVLIVVHGYGSHGVGGLIKTSTMQYLKNARKQGVIVDFVPGEFWCDTNEVKVQMCRLYPELILNNNLNFLNSGVSVVWVKK